MRFPQEILLSKNLTGKDKKFELADDDFKEKKSIKNNLTFF